MPFMQDPHCYDFLGPVPPWDPDAGRRWKRGQSKSAWIWPRDRPSSSSPTSSSRRWKDVLSGKGPPVYIGDRRQFGPTRDTWSNWLEFDNLGYRSEDVYDLKDPRHWKAYDFKRRRFVGDRHRTGVWSDVKWGRNRREGPLYVRDGIGQERTRRNGIVLPFDNTELGNDFRYKGHSNRWDWAAPWPREYWRRAL